VASDETAPRLSDGRSNSPSFIFRPTLCSLDAESVVK
jgi:hypothetical protein